MNRFKLKNILSISIIFILTSQLAYSQGGNLVWGRFFESSGSQPVIYTEPTKKIAIDPNFGDVYSVGTFKDSVDFDPGIGLYIGFHQQFQSGMVFINKLSFLGNHIWTKFIGGGGADFNIQGGAYRVYPTVVTDNLGNIYISGCFSGTADFDPGAGVYIISSTQGTWDAFILKLGPQGNFTWAKSFTGGDKSVINSLCVDDQYNVYTAGVFIGTVDFNPNSGINNLTSSTNSWNHVNEGDIFISKLDSQGNYIWSKGVVGSNINKVGAIDVDGTGNVYVSGLYNNGGGNVDFNPGTGVYNLPGQFGSFLMKLNNLGIFQWANPASTSFNSIEIKYTCDDSGNLLGFLENSIFKNDNSGNSLFNKAWATGFFISNLTSDILGNIYLSGTYGNAQFDADPGPNVFNLPNPILGTNNTAIIKLDASGNFIWAKSIAQGAGICGIATDDLSSLFINGTCSNGVDIDPGFGTLSSVSQNSFFVLKLSPPCGSSSTTSANLTACDSITIQGNIIQSDTTLSATYIDITGCDSLVNYTINIEETFSPTICLVTVDSLSNHNVIIYEKPAGMTSVDSFYVYREVGANVYQIVGALSDTSFSVFDDFAANPNSTSFKYKIASLNVCGQTSIQSPYHSTIHLQYLGAGNFQWTNYLIENVANPVLSYSFYRDNNSSGSFQLIQVIPGNNNTFTDVNYASYPNASYRVEVNWFIPANCNPTSRVSSSFNTSRSNILSFGTTGLGSVNQYPIIISPNPANEQFQIDFGSSYNSLLGGKINIYNTLGQSVYSLPIDKEKQIISRSTLDRSGIYFISVSNAQSLEVSRNKLVLQ